MMSEQFDAIFENGVFRPLAAVNFKESQRVTLNVEQIDGADGEDEIDPIWRGVLELPRKDNILITKEIPINAANRPDRATIN